MSRDILDEAQRLRAERRPFALATVVAAAPPASATPGARALVLPDGQIEGWVGGHCAKPTVARIARDALEDGAPRLLQLTPDAQAGTGHPPDAPTGVVRVPMTCAGQGELQIFVEPFLPKVALVVVGASPVAQALVRLGSVMEFEVWACDPQADMGAFPDAARLIDSLDALKPQLIAQSYVVVATIGEYDEEALLAALDSPASYVGVVASQKRLAALLTYLRQHGVSDETLKRVKRPKGTSATPQLPAEIAFSVMAELLEVRRKRIGLASEVPATAPRQEAIDPICGMTVDVATARYTAERDGVRYYFCSAGCQSAFAARS
ncbi:MAG TPA: XdhC family protein [Ktedonobacterales bacterium]|nr:XdhC family protein [Ktedonobacterales bacterium]